VTIPFNNHLFLVRMISSSPVIYEHACGAVDEPSRFFDASAC
jgi:hypothetical protein